jgi:hypothetical protein
VRQAFDELLLLKRGGETIFQGALGHESSNLVSYFQAVGYVAWAGLVGRVGLVISKAAVVRRLPCIL